MNRGGYDPGKHREQAGNLALVLVRDLLRKRIVTGVLVPPPPLMADQLIWDWAWAVNAPATRMMQASFISLEFWKIYWEFCAFARGRLLPGKEHSRWSFPFIDGGAGLGYEE
jgi:hypothetical protein